MSRICDRIMGAMVEPQASPLTVRDIRPDEVRRLHEIDRICFPDYMAYSRIELLFFLRQPRAISKAAERAGAIVGFTIGRIEHRAHAHVITLDVLPETRRQGIGTALMKALHDEFRKRGSAAAWLEVETSNVAAIDFYRGMGYEQERLLRGYYKARSDAYRMVLLL